MIGGRFRWLLLTAALLAAPAAMPAARAAANDGLQIIAIDVEGGGGTLFITPEGKSMMIDAGWADGSRATGKKDSSDRIVDTLHAFGLKKIDYFVMTHYHADHIGGFSALFHKIPIDTFVDHGANVQLNPPAPAAGAAPAAAPAAPAAAPAGGAPAAGRGPRGPSSEDLYEEYVSLIKGHRRIIAVPGQKLDIGSMHVLFVASNNKTIAMDKVSGAGGSDPYCAHFENHPRDGGIENVYSLGMLITYGKTRITELGDLTWNREQDLFCPNHIGPVDVEIAAGHGMDLSGSPASVNALRAQVVIVGNGQTKGGDVPVLDAYNAEPRLKGLWKLHTNPQHHQTDGDLNMIANTDDDLTKDKFYNLRVRVTKAGEITVINERNGFNKSYEAQGAKD
jgi:beta-lactamase superfamily II metal-dependent hydrolase